MLPRRVGTLILGIAALRCGGDPAQPPAITGAAHGTGTGATSGEAADDGAACGGPWLSKAGAEDPGTRFDVAGDGGGVDTPLDCEAAAMRMGSLGCEFWAVDLPNDGVGTPTSPPAQDQQFAVVVANAASLVAVRVDVLQADEAIASAMVEPGGTHVFPLAGETAVAYRVTADQPITAYQFNPLDNSVAVYSNDASLLLPTHALGQRYLAITGDPILVGETEDDPDPVLAPAFVAVAATEDDTRVEIEVTGSSATEATLRRGEVLTLTSADNLSGARVIASRAVAVFSGNVATAEPAGTGMCCADHIEHQLVPTSAWGSRYVLAPPPASDGDGDDPVRYRLVAGAVDAELSYCPARPPGAPAFVAATKSASFVTDAAFAVRSAGGRGFAIAQLLHSHEALGPDRDGDPAMLLAVPVAQLERRVGFAVPEGYATNFVTIVADSAVLLDGSPVPDEAWSETLVRYVHLPLEPGGHVVESSDPLAVSVFGYDAAVSYAFPGGAGLRVLDVDPEG